MIFLLFKGYFITKDYENVSAIMLRVDRKYTISSPVADEDNWHEYEVYQFDYNGKQ